MADIGVAQSLKVLRLSSRTKPERLASPHQHIESKTASHLNLSFLNQPALLSETPYNVSTLF